jgi:FkbM family methyltransferase
MEVGPVEWKRYLMSRKGYTRNKLRTALAFMQRIRNWPAAWRMKLRPRRGELRLLSFRDGLNLMIREGTGDEAVMHELMFAGGYRRALSYVGQVTDCAVLDLGANIGLFSLMAARLNPKVQVYAYEPGPENADLMQINLLINPALKDRIHVLRKGVSGLEGKAQWSFDSDNPGASGLFYDGSRGVEVELVSLGQALEEAGKRKAFVKMDIEGSEYDVIRDTPESVWNQVCGLAFELHDDPRKLIRRGDFLARVEGLGFRIEKEEIISYFAYRR